MNKKEELSNFHKHCILQAAKELFLEYGIEKTTMDMVAQKANYSKATVYIYLKSKEEMFYCLVFEYMKKLHNNIENLIHQPLSFDEVFFSICNEVVCLQKEGNIFFEGMIGNINMDIDNSNTLKIYKDIYDEGEKINTLLGTLINKGIAENRINQVDDIKPLILFLWSSISGIVRMTAQKQEYMEIMGVKQEVYFDFAFSKLLKAIEK